MYYKNRHYLTFRFVFFLTKQTPTLCIFSTQFTKTEREREREREKKSERDRDRQRERQREKGKIFDTNNYGSWISF